MNMIKFAAAAAITVAAIGIGASAQASTKPAPEWLMKSNDMQLLEGSVSIPTVTWVGCGKPSDPDGCGTYGGTDEIFTSNTTILHNAYVTDNPSYPVIYDIETWSYTPRPQRRHPLKAICKAIADASGDGAETIVTPYNPSPAEMEKEDVAAAKCGAYGVDIQAQFLNAHPYAYRGYVTAVTEAVRAVNPQIVVLAGLATNNPVPQTAAHLYRDYKYALKAGVNGFWFNAAVWSPNRCTKADGGPGCPAIAAAFFAKIGITQ